MPIDDGHEVHPSLEQSDIGNIDAPDMVWILGRDIAKEIGIDLVFQSPLAKVGPRMDPLDSHLPHGAPDAIPPDQSPLLLERGRNPSTPEKRPAGIDLVNPVPKSDLLFRRAHRTVVRDRSGHSSQSGLIREGEIRIP